jgi:hypothetical protein
MAKTYKNLYPQISDYRNLYGAWLKARKGKRYKVSTADFGQNLDAELLALHRDLLNETYEPGNYVHFIVHDPKRRRRGLKPIGFTNGSCPLKGHKSTRGFCVPSVDATTCSPRF